MKNNSPAHDWVAYASEDLRLAEKILHEKGFLPHAIFHSHESCEKYLKGLLIQDNGEIPKIHKLDVLTKDLPVSEKDQLDLMNLGGILDSLYRFSRYPGVNIDETLWTGEAKKAVQAALKAEKIIRRYLEEQQ
ncbi:MAG: HEPN domain-containing protein [bacterium]|nr:HEPN domain-containing protein [bacterium]